MSVHILYDAAKRKSVMFCSTDGIAFGPIFDNEDAADFVDAMLAKGTDPRDLHAADLLTAVEDWQDEFYTIESEEA